MTKFKDKMNSYKKHPGSFLLFLLVVAAAIITVAVLLYLVAYILIHGVPYLKPGLFALEYNSDNVSMLPAMINTLEYDAVFPAFCSTAWDCSRSLSGGICTEGK